VIELKSPGDAMRKARASKVKSNGLADVKKGIIQGGLSNVDINTKNWFK
jgi:hypothetical protein